MNNKTQETEINRCRICASDINAFMSFGDMPIENSFESGGKWITYVPEVGFIE